MNQERCSSSAPPDAADQLVLGDLDVAKADRGVSLGIVVGEVGVVGDLDPRAIAVDDEDRRQPLVALDHVGHHEVHGGNVAGGHEPLLGVEPEAGLGRVGGGRDRGRVGAGVALGHRVGVLELAAKRRTEVAVDLLGAGVGPDVVGVRNVPVDRVGGAAVLLLDQRPLEPAPPLPTVLAGVQAAAQPGVDRLALDPGDELVGKAPGSPLCLLLQRHQDVLGEGPRSVAERERSFADLERHPARDARRLGERLDLHRLVRLTCD